MMQSEYIKKTLGIIVNAIPVVLMIVLIPFIGNDYWLTGIYALIILVYLALRREKNDILFLILGFIVMFISEYVFIKTGVEQFNRKSLLGVMPLWLPFLWANAFVVIKRAIVIIS
ncbi:MAG: DUF2878 family protein [Candidatus Berkelbacteria bacterium]|nr:DUF2878 family protein [Candidatus Berkelbacteria bacterium]